MPKVYIVNAGGHNHHLAKSYGELTPITQGYVSQGSLDRILFDVIKGIKDSTSEDWLLLSGLMILNSLAAAAWLNKHGSLKMLVWDRKGKGRYRPFTTDSKHINELWEQLNEWGEDSSTRVAAER